MSDTLKVLASLAVVGSVMAPAAVLAEQQFETTAPQMLALGDDDSRRSVGTTIDDSVITGKAKAALAGTEGVDALDINVDTRAGVVSLAGTVDSTAEASLAESTVKDVKGVKAVDNQLKVKP